MNRSQLMGLDSVGIDIYDIHRYFREFMVGQRNLRFWEIIVHQVNLYVDVIQIHQVLAMNLRYYFVTMHFLF